jgi:YkoP domain
VVVETAFLHFTVSARPIGGASQWLEHAVFGLDRRLRRRQGVYEYSSDDNCLFRIQRIGAEEQLTLADGTRIGRGDPLLALHLWNEHMPAMARGAPTIAWARQISRTLDFSLRDLARYLAADPPLDDVVAIRADLRLGPDDFNAKLARIMAHHGFEAPGPVPDSASVIHRFGESILIFLLVLAANPASIRLPALSREHKPVYLSRAALQRRHAIGGDAQDRRGRSC